MTFITYCLILLILFLLVVLYSHQKLPYNFPPGPSQLPFVGNAPLFRKLCKTLGHQYRALTVLSKEFGPVVGLRLGRHLVVIVSGVETLRQLLGREEFEGRPDTFFMRLRSMGTRKGITSTDGSNWHEQRSFAIRHLRNLGFGRQPMSTLMEEELADLLKSFAAEQNSIKAGYDEIKGSLTELNLAPRVLNVLWGIVAGTRFSIDDPKLVDLLNLLRARSRAFDMAGGILSQFPWLRHIAPRASGYKLLLEVNAQMKEFLMDSIEQHKKTYVDGQVRDLIDAYICEMNSRKEDPHSEFTDDQLVMVCLDLFIAGSETTSNTLRFAFLLAALHPEIQDKVHSELDSVLSSDEDQSGYSNKRLPQLSDRARMPYCEAYLTEVQRLCHVTPVAGPRRAMCDTTLAEYNIPKDTVVLLNLRSVHMNRDHWGDPENFRPERFLKMNSQEGPAELQTHDDWLIPFGLGRRRCPGEVMARSFLFLFFAGVLSHFRLMPDPSNPCPEHPSLHSGTMPGLTLAPKPFQLLITSR